MKKWTFNAILLLLVLNTAWVYAQVEQTRKISKSFNVNSSTALNIDNKFGKVHINTHNGNTIKVDVTLVSRATDNSKAKNILDKLQVKVVEGNEISFKSGIISSIRSSRRWKRKGKRAFAINYLVSMPKSLKLKVRNRFGDVFLGDYSGELDVYVAYGNIKASKITNPSDKKINVAFGTLDIDQVEEGSLTVAYGTLKLDNGQKLQVKNNSSTVEINKVKNLNVVSKYGKLLLSQVDNISGQSSFDRVNIGLLNSNCTLSLKHAKGFEVSKVNKNFKKIDISGNFSPMNFKFENGASFDYQVNTQFGGLQSALLKSSTIRKQIEKNSSKYVEGKYGNGASKSKVTIKSKYGSVRIK